MIPITPNCYKTFIFFLKKNINVHKSLLKNEVNYLYILKQFKYFKNPTCYFSINNTVERDYAKIKKPTLFIRVMKTTCS